MIGLQIVSWKQCWLAGKKCLELFILKFSTYVMDNKIKRLREIGKFQLNAERKVLFYLDKPIDLPLKEIELLCVLTENGGELVTKEELLNRVWKDSFVDESNLTRHIYRLRKMFAEYGEMEEMIQNVPRRGYRFTGNVVHKIFEQPDDELITERQPPPIITEISAPTPPEVTAFPPSIKSPTGLEGAESGSYSTRLWATLGIFLIGSFSFLGYNYLKPKRLIDTVFKKTIVEKVPITGRLNSVAISPDGKYLAYVNEEPAKNGILMLYQLETGKEREVLNAPDAMIEVRNFSPDGNYLYFEYTADTDSYSSFKRVAVLGGEMTDVPSALESDVGISPDGKKSIFFRRVNNDEAQQIIVADLDSKAETIVYTTKDDYVYSPRLSPDGSKILVLYGDKKEGVSKPAKLGWIPVSGGGITRIGNDTWNALNSKWPYTIYSHYRWLLDGSGIVFTVRLEPEDNFQIFMVSFPRGEVTRVALDNSDYYTATATTTSDHQILATIKKIFTDSIWEYDLQTKKAKQIKAISNLSSGEDGIATTLDNKLLFCQLDGKGNRDLWQMNSDGSGAGLFVSGKGKIENPMVSADGKYVYFTTNSYEWSPTVRTNAIWRVNRNSSNPEQLTAAMDGRQLLIGVYPDNRNLLFLDWVDEGFNYRAKKFNLDSRQTLPIFDDKNLFLMRMDLSPNGKKILYATFNKVSGQVPNSNTTFRVADFDGTKMKETPLTLPRFWAPYLWPGRFAPDSKSVYYFPYSTPNEVWQVELDHGKSTRIASFNFDKIYNLTVSRDGKKLYLVLGNTTDEVLLIKNIE